MKYSVLALVGVVTSNELVSMEDPPKTEAPKAVTPDSNRATFEAAVSSADKVVNTQEKTENKNVTTITDIHKDAKDKTHN